MSKAEQIQRLDPWNTAAPAFTAGETLSVPSYYPEDDQVAWPPVIARIRDLDKPITSQASPVVSAPAAPTATLSNPIASKGSLPRRKVQNLPSQLIALVGIIIFLMAIVPFLPFRNGKSDSEAVNNGWQPLPPAAKSELSPPFTAAGTPTTKESAEKTPVQSAMTPSNTAATNANAAGATTAPTLLTAEKKEPNNLLVNPAPTGPANPAGVPSESTAAQFPAAPHAFSPQNTAPNNPNFSQQPNGQAQEVVENGESIPWNPPANPPQNGQMNAGNSRYPAAPDSGTIPPPPAMNVYGVPAANPNQPMAPAVNPAPVLAESPQTNPQTPWAQVPPPSTPVPNGENNGILQADLRNNVRRPWKYGPDNSNNPPTNTLLPPGGQSQGQPTEQLIPSGGQVPSINVRQGTMMPPAQPQVPQQYHPNQPLPQGYQQAQPSPTNAVPNNIANTMPSGGYPPPANNYYHPASAPAGNMNPPADYSGGYSIPATTVPQ